ncbi:hypothetical protein NST23_14000 [Brevibacillus sp. FSL K6-0770]|uniref:hypothetical protein n=1 Tax=Brevibacillus sp. FSL K6-0770 TaxID=2954673 RepID=UPI0030F88AD5
MEDTYKGQVDNPLSLNRYTYVENNPLRYVDPTGHWKQGDELLPSNIQDQIRVFTKMWENGDAHTKVIAEMSADYLRDQYMYSVANEIDKVVYNIQLMSSLDSLMTNAGKALSNQLRKDIAKQLGKYKDVGGHHVHAKAGFKGHATYSPEEGFAISQSFMKERGWSHQDMTTAQRRLFKELKESGRPNTLFEHTRIAVEALKAGGASRDEARYLVTQSLLNLREQLVRNPTRIPWYD